MSKSWQKSFFSDEIEFIPDDGQDDSKSKFNTNPENILEFLKYQHQSCITTSPSKVHQITQLADRLREGNRRFEVTALYPQFQDGRQIRLISHNDKLEALKLVAKGLQLDIQMEMITKALKPNSEMSAEKVERLCGKFRDYFPMSNFEALYDE